MAISPWRPGFHDTNRNSGVTHDIGESTPVDSAAYD
jgi:hypothetical protein